MVVVTSFPMESMTPHHDAKDVLHLFNTNPMKFVSMMQKVNPDQLQEILSLLQGMLTESIQKHNGLEANVSNISLELADASVIEGEKFEVLKNVNDTRNTAIIEVQVAEDTVKVKEQNLILAKQERDEQLPTLLKEQEVLRDVIEKLRHLTPCTSHSDCDSSMFCHIDGNCAACSKCHFNDIAVNGQCPVKCPVLCEDDPPTYPKCPLCKDHTHCDEIERFLACDSNVTKCAAHSRCKFENEEWVIKMLDKEDEFWSQNKTLKHEDWPAAGYHLCQCYHDQFHCLFDENCFVEDHDDYSYDNYDYEDDSEHDDFAICTEGLKCSPEQCDFVERYEALLKKSFLSKIAQLKKSIKSHTL